MFVRRNGRSHQVSFTIRPFSQVNFLRPSVAKALLLDVRNSGLSQGDFTVPFTFKGRLHYSHSHLPTDAMDHQLFLHFGTYQIKSFCSRNSQIRIMRTSFHCEQNNQKGAALGAKESHISGVCLRPPSSRCPRRCRPTTSWTACPSPSPSWRHSTQNFSPQVIS